MAMERVAKLRDLDVVLIPEPPHSEVLMYHAWRGFKLVQASPAPSHALILARENLHATPCPVSSSRVCGVSIDFRGTPLVLISVYIRHTSGDGADQLSRALAVASDCSPLVFVGMDANGHSPQWGPAGSRVDRVGELVEG